MKADFDRVHWGRVLLAAAVAAGLSVVLVLLVVTIYTTSLAFQARAQPDQVEIAAFAAQVSRWLRPVLAMLLAFGGAFWVVRKVDGPAQLQGGLVGVVVALALLAATMLFGGALDLLALAGLILTVAVAWLGGTIGSRKRSQAP
ncbi:MAG TPA: hypothetical protein VFU22_06740 [Roseiflexaceae bacterium]|nr:hypothetical protein [Roseiflexaceae bacterium]